MIAEMLGGRFRSNCGGRNHIALDVERQIALWMAQAFGFPLDASGIFVTGASMANFLYCWSRERAAGAKNVRLNGLNALDSMLVAYASREVHNCVRQAISELSRARRAAFAADFFRRAPRHAGRRPRSRHRRRPRGRVYAVHDRRHGRHGDTGAVDDLDALADVAHEEDIWFHVDGAFPTLAVLKLRRSSLW